MSEEEAKYFKSLIGFTFDSDDIRYIEKMVLKKDKEIERLNNIIKEVRNNINKKLNINSDYVDYDFGTELLRQELLEILNKGEIK